MNLVKTEAFLTHLLWDNDSITNLSLKDGLMHGKDFIHVSLISSYFNDWLLTKNRQIIITFSPSEKPEFYYEIYDTITGNSLKCDEKPQIKPSYAWKRAIEYYLINDL